ncbi:MAG TPA: DUF177 domain-containing protein [Acidimicrobiales bacterium]|nr:DUF177 domain-containing protein [Acidimicrobiales bacterium]
MAHRDLILGVADLLARPGRRRDEHLEVELEDLVVLGSRVAEGEAVRIDVRLEALNEAVVVKGTAAAPWSGECRRCLGPVRATLHAPILEIFEAEPTEGETRPLHGDSVDVEPVVREAVLLELPLAPLCRADCAGLCPQCGTDRNQVDCRCAQEVGDRRWAGLDQLHFE